MKTNMSQWIHFILIVVGTCLLFTRHLPIGVLLLWLALFNDWSGDKNENK